jgi:hypothetical protein
MIYLTQLIYINTGFETDFDKFEELAIPLISKYNGQLLLRLRPDESSVVERNIELPYEVHLVSFDSASDFDNFKKDKERNNFLHLKNRAVRKVILIEGAAVI